MKIIVCRTDSKPLSKEVSGLGRVVKIRQFKTVKEAEQFVENLPDKKGVFAGDYAIDVPERK
jgi:hypothetical protein